MSKPQIIMRRRKDRGRAKQKERESTGRKEDWIEEGRLEGRQDEEARGYVLRWRGV